MNLQQPLLKLWELFDEAVDKYYNDGDSPLTDAEFDELYDYLKKNDPTSLKIHKVGAKSNSVWPKVKHAQPMGSLLKMHDSVELEKWSDKYTTGAMCWSDKLDGFSISLKYENGKFVQAVTRGDGETGDDITPNVLKMKGLVLKVPKGPGFDYHIGKSTFYVRAEVVLLKKDFEKHFAGEKNPRNSAVGCSRRLDGAGCEHLSIITYKIDRSSSLLTMKGNFDLLETMGFMTVNWGIGKSDDIQKIFNEYVEKIRARLPYEIDGLVIYDNCLENFEKQGIVDGRPRAARAYKFPSLDVETTINSVVWQTGRTGVITPVALIEPTAIGGITVGRVNLINPNEIWGLGVGIGSKAILTRCNDVIPRITKTLSKGKKIEIPDKCPSCNHPTEIQESIISSRLVCTNKDDCPAQNMGLFLHFLRALDVKGVGESLIEKLMEAGKLTVLPDLYKLQVSDIADLESVGEKVAIKVLNDLEEKSKNIDIPTFIEALGMPQFGQGAAKLLIEKFPTIEAMIEAKPEELRIPKIGDSIIDAITKGFALRKEVIFELLSNGYIKLERPKAMVVDGPMTGFAVCFTGIRSEELEAVILSRGGKIASGVSKNTTHLLCKDISSTTGKTQKARELGIKIMTLEEFQEEYSGKKSGN